MSSIDLAFTGTFAYVLVSSLVIITKIAVLAIALFFYELSDGNESIGEFLDKHSQRPPNKIMASLIILVTFIYVFTGDETVSQFVIYLRDK